VAGIDGKVGAFPVAGRSQRMGDTDLGASRQLERSGHGRLL
jgi:hypothetical protein